MPTDKPLLIELLFSRNGDTVTETARGSRGEYPSPRDLAFTFTRLAALRQSVGRHAQDHTRFDQATAQEARDLHRDVFGGKAGEMLAAYRALAGGAPIPVRLVFADPGLHAIPFEVMCDPDTQEGFVATSDTVRVFRAVTNGDAFVPREVTGRVRVLLLAAVDAGVPEAVRAGLADAIASGAVEWLDPIVGERVAVGNLRKSLLAFARPNRSPHILHIIGHGNVIKDEQRPVLELPTDGEPVTISAESLAQDLAELFGDTLRLIVLDACRSASPGEVGSAAEILARRAAGGVVAHLWKVRTDVAGAGSKSLYTSLTLWGQKSGDVAASLNGARRELLRGDGALPGGAGAFSPVLYLRGDSTVLFDFARPSQPPRVEPSVVVAGDSPGDATSMLSDLAKLTREMAEATSLLTGSLEKTLDDEGTLDDALHTQEERSALSTLLGKLTFMNVMQSPLPLQIEGYCDSPSPARWKFIQYNLHDLAKTCEDAIQILASGTAKFAVERNRVFGSLVSGLTQRRVVIDTLRSLGPPTADADIRALREVGAAYQRLVDELSSNRRVLLGYVRDHLEPPRR